MTIKGIHRSIMTSIKSKYLLTIPIVLLTITIFNGIFLSSIIVNADGNTSTTDTLNITVNSACTMMGGANGDSTSDNTFTATIDPSTYQEFTGSKLTTLCNDKDGYAIYAIGYSGDSYNAPDNNKLLGQGTIAGTNINTATTGDNSYWAMKLTPVSGTTPPTILNNFNNYHVIPETYTAIAKYATNTSSSSTGATIQTNYKVSISSSQIAGSYQGKVKYTMVHPNTAPEPKVPVLCTTPVPNLTYMQDLNSSNKSTILAEMDEDKQYFLKDKRDEKSYCVAELRDGNLWMTQNLDLDIDSTKTYTPTDTDLPTNTTWTPMRSIHQANDKNWLYRSYVSDIDYGDDFCHTDAGTIYCDLGRVQPEAYDPGDLYWNGDPCVIDQEAGNWSCPDPVSLGDSNYHLGNYYNWTAAIATNDSSSYIAQDVDQSICPAGWTLPKGWGYSGQSTSGLISYLVERYGWSDQTYAMENPNIWDTAIKTGLSGSWGGDDEITSVITGLVGAFWTSTTFGYAASDSVVIYYDGLVSSNFSYNRYAGYNVRCVAR